ncbi:MAG: M48 family metalloprotease [Candidatus Nanosyncoccaceae bacterium]|jgi:heat shock protein HtpX
MYSQIDKNKRKTWLVMAMFFVIIAIIGALVGYLSDDFSVTWIMLGISAIYALIQYFFASKMAIMMSGAREVDRQSAPRLYHVVETLTITTGLPMPKIYVIDDSSPNAFATGRDPEHAAVAATTGLIEMMDERELTGVIAHEMAHIGNYDIRVSLVALALTAAIGFMSDMILRGFRFSSSRDRDNRSGGGLGMVLLLIVAVLAPIMATLIQLAVSRKREYLADATASLTTRDPEGLARALEKLRDDRQPMRKFNSSMANMYIKNPIKKGFASSLFSTHPPIEERIKILRGMEGQF